MEDLNAYTPEEIILANLAELSGRFDALREQLSAHLRELALELSAGMGDRTAFLSSLADHGADLDRLLPPPDADRAKAYLALELRRLLPRDGTQWLDWYLPAGDEPSAAAHNRIAYQRNRFTDEAFTRFSTLLRDARAAYPHTFRAVCDEVAGGTCEYCILPVESSGEGRLHAFTSLIEAYGLKIVAVCTVPIGDGRETLYALLRRSLLPLRTPDGTPWWSEISCDTSGRGPEGILGGAALCGMVPEYAEFRRGSLRAVFPPDGDLPAFLLFLSLAYPHFEITGLFRHPK